jgi:uncharacterized protein YqeY
MDKEADMRDRIAEAMKQALKSGDKQRLGTLRLVMAAIKDREIALQMEGKGAVLTDGDTLQVLQKMVKQRRDSAEAYEKGGRPELAAQERSEIAVIEEFLPRQMSEGDVREAVSKAAQELGAKSIKDMGPVMAELRKRYAGQMDFAKASALLRELLK